MNLTFGIMTQYDNIPQLNEVITSIKSLNVPDVEIIVVGSYNDHDYAKVDATVQQVLTDGWTPRKKNLVAKMARHETMVLLHDYFLFDKDWYASYREFGSEWDICSNQQFLLNGKRHFTDWVLWGHPTLPRYHSLDYNDWANTKYQYVSGGYFLVKRDFLRANPFNEAMQPGSPEDIEWSLRIRDTAVIKCNPRAIVRHNKVHRDNDKKGFPYEQ